MKKVLVITSCTGDKSVSDEEQLTLNDFRKGLRHLRVREKSLAHLKTRADQLYTGQHHIRLMRGVDAVVSNNKPTGLELDIRILSAGYGFIRPESEIPPYECTFQTMNAKQIDNWADELGTPKQFRDLVSEKYDLALLLLSDDYLRACRLNQNVNLGGATIILCGSSLKKKLPQINKLHPLVVSTPETRRFNCGHVALKGEIGGRILKALHDGTLTLKTLLTNEDKTFSVIEKISTQNQSSRVAVKSKRQTKTTRQRFSVHTPRKSALVQYFIPEWDDRVDPNYDFSIDGITPERDPYVDDVYSHEIFGKPNYDGILVSKSVIEDNQKKKSRIESVGIHSHVRVPRNFPVMGDCGAFNYINDFEPPYRTEETVRFYQTLDFDFGVSIDHLIVPQHMQAEKRVFIDEQGTEKNLTELEFNELLNDGIKLNKSRPTKKLFNAGRELYLWLENDLSEAKRRWDLTLRNSEDFINEHKRQRATFTPIAGCQGWDVTSQVEMFTLQQEMGYDYIALGGLIRSKTNAILEILDAVNKVRKRSTKIHLFGIARPEAIKHFVQQGVTSIDSARFLRQAWLSATSNYYAGNPKDLLAGNAPPLPRYTAIRIPPIYRENSKTIIGKAKKVTSDGYPVEQLELMEKRTLDLVHAFDRGEADIEETLSAITEYDLLMGGDTRNGPLYRKLLEDKPWKDCPCEVCREAGVDVVIFRRNNRNRRRGFHNTWWFFEFFRQATTSQQEEK